MKKVFLAILMLMLLFTSYGEEIAQEAALHLDKPYSYTSEGPNAFDCSGFVFYCYKKHYNIELPRTAKEQGYSDKYITIIHIKNLRLGDMVYFNTNRGDSDVCDHAGIYIGNGEFIHASSAKGKVIKSTLLTGYYNERFSWGKRITRRVKNGTCND